MVVTLGEEMGTGWGHRSFWDGGYVSHLDAGNTDILFLTFFKLYVICAQF